MEEQIKKIVDDIAESMKPFLFNQITPKLQAEIEQVVVLKLKNYVNEESRWADGNGEIPNWRVRIVFNADHLPGHLLEVSEKFWETGEKEIVEVTVNREAASQSCNEHTGFIYMQDVRTGKSYSLIAGIVKVMYMRDWLN